MPVEYINANTATQARNTVKSKSRVVLSTSLDLGRTRLRRKQLNSKVAKVYRVEYRKV